MPTKQDTVISLRIPAAMLKRIDGLVKDQMSCRAHIALWLIKLGLENGSKKETA